MSVLRLAIPSPLRQTFDYLPPAALTDEELQQLRPGTRLRAPFGSREVVGILLETCRESGTGSQELKQVIEILDDEALIPPAMMSLCRWAASYYHHPPGEVYPCALPNRLRKGGSRLPNGEDGWQLSTRGKGLPEGALARSPRQAQALSLLQQTPAVAATRLSGEGISTAVMRELEKKGLVERTLLPVPWRQATSSGELSPTREQQQVLDSLLSSQEGFSCHLLEGVTGSGKTEVYLQLIADCLQRGRQALVLIPEIGLTPQTLQRFERRFEANIAVFHSALAAGERCRAWESARDGTAHIVIGTRSAVFTPLANIGLIIVDEEHDLSYKQQDGFRYSARDVAVKRGQLEGCPVLLGSATPSLESLYNALAGRYRLHELKNRAGGARLPSIKSLDVRKRELRAGLSEPLLESMQATLSGGGQVLLFLNRRGYAPTLRCHDCGWIAQCSECDARLTLHRRQRKMRCHHCGTARLCPNNCPECASPRLLTSGLGTEQSEDFLRGYFDQWPLYRVDSDTMKGRGDMAKLVAEINRGQPCILLGTQMLTKGHHFPSVNLVGVIDADAMLFSADFRGEERMAQLLTQVAGRAGRAGEDGQVILQTHYPDHPSMTAALKLSYPEQARGMLQQRRESGLPPVGQLLLLRTDCKDDRFGEDFLRSLRQKAEPALPDGCTLIGPLPAPLQRRAGKFRSQLMLSAPNRRAAQAAASLLVEQAGTLPPKHQVKWSIDIDPQDLF